MTYTEVQKLRKSAGLFSEQTKRGLTAQEKERRMREITKSLGKLFAYPDTVVVTPTLEEVSDKHLNDILGYAEAVADWEKGKEHKGQVDLFFDRDTEMPIGYGYGDDSGIYSDASVEDLQKAIKWAVMPKALAKKRKLL